MSTLRSGRLGPLAALALALGSLLWLIAAQMSLNQQRLNLWTVVALAAGLICWILVVGRGPAFYRRAITALAPAAGGRLWLLPSVGLMAVATWLAAASGVYSRGVVLAWLVGLALWFAVWWPVSTVRLFDRPGAAVLWLLPILLLGAVFLFYRLGLTPGDPTSDHAEKLLDVYDLQRGARPIFFPRNTGREPGQFYITLGLMRLVDLPLRFETLKFGTALIGLLTIPAVFLFARELAGTRAGLLAAALEAISKWPTAIARMGLRFPYGTLPTALMLWLLLRYLRRGDRRDALLCGLVIGLGLHGYIAFRIVPLAVPVLLALALLLDRRWRGAWRRLLIDGLLLVITAFLAVLPLARYSVDHPDQVWYRVATRAASEERSLGSALETLRTFGDNNRRALLAFNWRGDETVVNAVSFDPLLDMVTGAALLAGVVVAIGTVGRDWRIGGLLLVLPVLLLPSTLSVAFPNENPSANRLGPVVPVIFLLAALCFDRIAALAWGVEGRAARPARLVAAGSIGLLIALATQQNYVRYFRDFDRQYRSFVPHTHEIAAAITAQGLTLDRVYILAYPYWIDGRNVALMLGAIAWQPDHDLPSEVTLPADDGAPLLFVLNPNDAVRLQQLRERFPRGRFEIVTNDAPTPFALYTVPAR